MNQTTPGILQRAVLLFLSFYFLLYMFPFPLDQIPFVSIGIDYYGKWMDQLALWFGKTLLHLPGLKKIEMTGSGDTLLDYVRSLLLILLAVIGTLTVLLADRKKEMGPRIFSFLLVYARYYLGLFLLVYGFGKIFPSQFPPSDPSRMEDTFGSASPMGLLWTFMGASKSFTFFSGLMEITAGYLLLFRRTKTLGALISIAVMTNVVMLNFSYDVPVKLFSVHLVLISFLVIWRDIGKLALFFTGKQTSALDYPIYVYNKNYKRLISRWAKGIVIIGFSILFISDDYEATTNSAGKPTSAQRDGCYKPSLIILNNDTLVSDQKQALSKLLINGEYMGLVNGSENLTYYKSSFDTVAKVIHLTSSKDSTKRYNFAYREEKGNLDLNGMWNGKMLQAVFRKKDPKNYLLLNRGFHWINEYAYNR
jgi:uncharacterized membrane protein YphA (DoxX/SURF4 family)